MTSNATMMGFNAPGDTFVKVPVRDWTALKLALWRSKIAWEISAREAVVILTRCRHDRGCPGTEVETEACFVSCPDREIRMSALVILNAARQLMPTIAARPSDAPYFAPSREYFSEVLAELATAQAELEMLRSKNMSVQAAAEELIRSIPPPPSVAMNRLASPTIVDFDPGDDGEADDEADISPSPHEEVS